MITHLPYSRSGEVNRHSKTACPSSYRFVHDAPHWPPTLESFSPGQDESKDQVLQRLERERSARLVSESIDRALSAERARRKKMQPVVKILLLGQAESGKSTTLKNFQLHFTPRAFRADADAWRIVIYLNLIRSVNSIIELLDSESANPHFDKASTSPFVLLFNANRTDRPERLEPKGSQGKNQGNAQRRPRTADGALGRTGGPASPPPFGHVVPSSPAYSPEIRRLKLSLLPLKSIEATLNAFLETVPTSATQAAHSTMFQRSFIQRSNHSTIFRPPTASARSPSVFPRATERDPPQRPSSSQSTSSSSSESLPPRKGFRTRLTRRHSLTTSTSTSTSDEAQSQEQYVHVHSVSADSTLCIRSPGSVGQFPDLNEPDDVSPTASYPSQFPSRQNTLHMELTVRVRGNSGWKRLARVIGLGDSLGVKSDTRAEYHEGDNKSMVSIGSFAGRIPHVQIKRELQAARQVIEACGEDMHKLWTNRDVQALMRRSLIQLKSQPGFFLDDVLRITAPDYSPSTDDILRARLSTLGVEEHHLVLESGAESGQEWVIYDVGGCRSQRAVWAPFFDNVTAIIFLAPLSAFNERLAEDPSINRLQDTYMLWRMICSNRILGSVEFILFMNKYDILVQKLGSGVRFSDYVTKYVDENGANNEPGMVAKYLLTMFHNAHKHLSPRPRRLHAYLTSVIDSRATLKVLYHVREQVIVKHLVESKLL